MTIPSLLSRCKPRSYSPLDNCLRQTAGSSFVDLREPVHAETLFPSFSQHLIRLESNSTKYLYSRPSLHKLSLNKEHFAPEFFSANGSDASRGSMRFLITHLQASRSKHLPFRPSATLTFCSRPASLSLPSHCGPLRGYQHPTSVMYKSPNGKPPQQI